MQSVPRAVIWLAAAMLLLSTAFAATANAQSDSLVLVDDMEDPAVGLLSEVSANPDLSAFTYFDGRYFIQTLQEGTTGDIFSFLNTNPVSDTIMSIDLAIGGDQTGKYGLIGCRAGIDNAGYQFSLEPAAGVAALWRIDPSGAVKLGEADVADLVVPGTDFNTLGIGCEGNVIAAAINGEVVLSQNDDTYTSGLSYIGAGAYEGAPETVVAAFDDLIIEDVGSTDAIFGESTDASTDTSVESRIAQISGTTPTAGPVSGVGDLVDQETQFLPVGITTADFYAETAFVTPTDPPAGIWSVGFCFWIMDDTSCTEVSLAVAGTEGRWFLAANNGDGGFDMLTSGEVTTLDLTPGATNVIGLLVEGSEGTLLVNSYDPAAIITFENEPVASDVSVLTSFEAETAGEQGFMTMEIVDFVAWDLTADQAASELDSNFALLKSIATLDASVAGPTLGSLAQNDLTIATEIAQVDLADSFVSATFFNPIDVATPWDFGIGIRSTAGDLDVRFIVDSNGGWTVMTGSDTVLDSGQVDSVETLADGSNLVEITAVGDLAILAVNGFTVAEITLPADPASGSVYIGSGFFTQTTVEGRTIDFQDFEVWSLDA